MAKIIDGSGKGYEAKVTSSNRLLTEALSVPIQHAVSHDKQQSYQVISTIDIAASKQYFLSVTNTSSTKDMIVTYIRVNSASAAATNEDAFFSIEVNGSYTSGGSAVIPTNVYVGSPNSADVEAYGNGAITTGGTPLEIDRNYTANSMQSFSKEGSIVIPKNATIHIAHTGSTAAGTAYARISFYMNEPS